MSEFRLVYMTASSKEEAVKISGHLLEKRLAACTNIIEGMHSQYRWEGQLQQSQETVVIAKTRSSLLQELILEVKSVHSHQVPCIVALDIQDGNPDYLKWLSQETS